MRSPDALRGPGRSGALEPRQGEEWLDHLLSENARSHVLPERRSQLETCPDPPPTIQAFSGPVAIDDVVPVGAALVLAHPGLDHGGLGQAGEATREKGPGPSDSRKRGRTVARRRVERRAGSVVGDLEAAPLAPGIP